MINKKDLKNWISEGDRQRSIEAIEKYIDDAIHYNAIKNNLTFCVRTGVWGNENSEKTDFYDIWFDKNLTPENRRIVQDRVLKKYQDEGFDVRTVNLDCGWNNSYEAVRFTNVDKVFENTPEE